MLKQQWRATYEDTLVKQEEHRKMLNKLIRESRCINDDAERDMMFPLTGDAYLGEDAKLEVVKFVHYPSQWVDLKDFGGFIREILDFDGSLVPISFFDEDDNSEEVVDISLVWKAVKKVSYVIYPRAQDKAIRMSKEQQVMHSAGDAVDYDDLTESK